jgi:hypothetical protein
MFHMASFGVVFLLQQEPFGPRENPKALSITVACRCDAPCSLSSNDRSTDPGYWLLIKGINYIFGYRGAGTCKLQLILHNYTRH